MSIATKAQIKKVLATKPKTDKYGYAMDDAASLRNAIVNHLRLPSTKVTSGEYVISDQDIDKYLQSELDGILMHRLGKGIRPWEIVNVTEKLDPKQAWIGVEYETGYDTGEDYRAVANFVWNNFVNSTIDGEGANTYPCELTFPPITYNDFMDPSKNPMDRLYSFMAENKIVVDDSWTRAGCNCGDPDCDDYYDDDEQQIGTHCNISTPSYRNLDGGAKTNVAEVMNNSLNTLSTKMVTTHFGRTPYGGFYNRGSDRQNTSWIEGKLFRSTGDAKVWEKYKVVMGRLAEVIEAVSAVLADPAEETHRGGKRLAVTNFNKYLSGEDTEVKLGFTSKRSNEWSSDDWW